MEQFLKEHFVMDYMVHYPTKFASWPIVVYWKLHWMPIITSGVLIWRYGTAVGARTTYSGVKDEIFGAKACFLINK